MYVVLAVLTQRDIQCSVNAQASLGSDTEDESIYSWICLHHIHYLGFASSVLVKTHGLGWLLKGFSSSIWDQHNLLYQGGEINLGAVGYLRLFAVELLKFPLRHLSPVLTKLSWKTRCKEQAAGWQQCVFLSSTSSSPLPWRTSFLLTSQDSFWRQLLL